MITNHERAIKYLRKGADLLMESDDFVHLPDSDIRIQNDDVRYLGEDERGQKVEEKDLADLIRYLADMMGN